MFTIQEVYCIYKKTREVTIYTPLVGSGQGRCNINLILNSNMDLILGALST